jgi:hypothetical protein
MKLLGACCLLLVASPVFGQGTKSQLWGSWRYDVKSMKITFNAATKKRIQKEGPGASARIEQMKQGLAKQLGIMTITFARDGRIQVAMDGYPTKLFGNWTLKGKQIKVVMDDKSQKPPQLELLPGGKKIRASFSQPSFGSGAVNLLKKS